MGQALRSALPELLPELVRRFPTPRNAPERTAPLPGRAGRRAQKWALCRKFGDGRYWARTSDPQLVEEDQGADETY